MTKHEFLKRLSLALGRMKRAERDKSLAFYREMIDDRIEAGLTEEAAVAEMEDISVIAAGILEDAGARGALKKQYNVLTVVLLVVGSPLWVSLLLVLFAVMAVFTVCLWVLVVCLYVGVLALAAVTVGGMCGFASLLGVLPAGAFFPLGAALGAAGLGMLLLMLSLLVTRGAARLTAGMWRVVCARLFGRRRSA